MASGQIRHHNKEPEWSSLCNNVFDQYLDGHDVLGLGNGSRERSSSDDSVNLFDLSGSSEQSNRTAGTSPVPAWEYAPVPTTVQQAQQPQARESLDFWQKTLRALERNAAESEDKQKTLRSTKSHPDFLGLGGFPSPPAVPCPVPSQTFSVPRNRPRESANGSKRSTSQVRSISRGRPTGVAKNTNPYATIRKGSLSPHKMMNPSRYRAGFRDVWADKLECSPDKYVLRVPTQPLPESPPSSAQSHQHDFAAFGSPTHASFLAAYDAELSPLTTTFQQARLHTPDASPFFSPSGHGAPSYFEHNIPATYVPQTVPLNDTTHAFPERTSSLAANRIGSFDFGFSTAPGDENWASSYDQNPVTDYAATHLHSQDPFAGIDSTILPSVEQTGQYPAGLGISYDTILLSNVSAASDYAALPATAYQPLPQPTPKGYYVSPHQPSGLPCTPRRQTAPRMQSESPSPPMTEPRSRRASGSRSRRTSKHRRAKSTTGTPRHSQNLEKGGFVNFTPYDSNKILSGVAPSGSSKTKARREKEAADKRRRLSQAAVKAVVEAGGDIESLTRAGLVI